MGRVMAEWLGEHEGGLDILPNVPWGGGGQRRRSGAGGGGGEGGGEE